jgi:predicted nucleotidyltransferase component of viral defense system
MIPKAHVTHWRNNYAPWPLDEQVEQDLVISRALVELFDEPDIAASFAFRGGTALHKLHLAPAVRYSEDIDLVQVVAGPIGPLLDVIRTRLGWLGSAKYKQTQNMCTLAFRFETDTKPSIRMRLKVEINTREAFTTHGVIDRPFEVDSPWFDGAATLRTFTLEELLGTKLRALYQRRKGRDAFDLAHALDRQPQLERQAVVDSFTAYMARGGSLPSHTMFERNLAEKRANAAFMSDMDALLHPQYGHYDPARALDRIEAEFLSLLDRDQ